MFSLGFSKFVSTSESTIKESIDANISLANMNISRRKISRKKSYGCSSLLIMTHLLILTMGFSRPYSTVSALPRSRTPTSFSGLFRGGYVLNAVQKDVIVDCNVEEEQQNIKLAPVKDEKRITNESSETELEAKMKVRGMEVLDMPMPTSYVAETKLPTDVGHFRMRAYRIDEDMQELHMQRSKHVGIEQIVIYNPKYPPFGKSGVTLRIHDQCITSEIFFSNRRDGGDQFKKALQYVQEHGGFIIYLQQEGRGIGFANNIAAHALQDEGMDGSDVNNHLGLPDDCRQYGPVPAILNDMGIESVKLMTNNPRKTQRIAALGVKVKGTVPMI